MADEIAGAIYVNNLSAVVYLHLILPQKNRYMMKHRALKLAVRILSSLMAFVPLLMSSCNVLEDLERRVEALEERMERMNNSLLAITRLVHAMENNIYIVDVQETDDGYIVDMSDGESLVIRHGRDGSNGKDGICNVVGIREDGGIYYWTISIDGEEEWLLDSDGNKIPVAGQDGSDGKDGVTPFFRIDEDGYWMVSYDGGISYDYLSDADGEKVKASGADGDSLFVSVEERNGYVYFTLANGTAITIPLQSELSIVFDISGPLAIFPGSTFSVGYTISGVTEKTIVKAFGQNGWSAKAVPSDADSGKILITASQAVSEDDEIIVLVYDGYETTIMATINCVKGIYEIMDNSFEVSAEGGIITTYIQTNLSYNIVIPLSARSWITCLPTSRSVRTEEISFSISRNSGEPRMTIIELQDESGFVLTQIGIVQGSGERPGYAALMALYNATDGDNWTSNANWGTDADFSQWYGVEADADGNVIGLNLNGNNLSGQIPQTLIDCSTLAYADLRNNFLTVSTITVPNDRIEEVSDMLVVYPQKNRDFRLFVDSESDGIGPVHEDGSYEYYCKSTEGEGVNLFVVGEGYDREENSVGGTAEYWMRRAAEAIFSKEPMGKLKKYCNVVLVYAHSAERGITLWDSSRETKFNYRQENPDKSSSAIINRPVCRNFIEESTGAGSIAGSHVIVVVNSTHNALYGGINLLLNSVSYSLIPTRPISFDALVNHEAVGHGIAHLGDEYVGSIAYDNSKDEAISANANLDIVSDPEKVKWAEFIADKRYSDENIGIFEGGRGYKTGVFRPTETSIMRFADSEYDFNAPSRAAIYESVLSDAFPEWAFDYEEFVRFDKMP